MIRTRQSLTKGRSLRYSLDSAALRLGSGFAAALRAPSGLTSRQRRRRHDSRTFVLRHARLPLALHRILDDRREALGLFLRVALFAFLELRKDFPAEQVERAANVLMLVVAG